MIDAYEYGKIESDHPIWLFRLSEWLSYNEDKETEYVIVSESFGETAIFPCDANGKVTKWDILFQIDECDKWKAIEKAGWCFVGNSKADEARRIDEWIGKVMPHI
jgi:hypothetical protein